MGAQPGVRVQPGVRDQTRKGLSLGVKLTVGSGLRLGFRLTLGLGLREQRVGVYGLILPDSFQARARDFLRE